MFNIYIDFPSPLDVDTMHDCVIFNMCVDLLPHTCDLDMCFYKIGDLI